MKRILIILLSILASCNIFAQTKETSNVSLEAENAYKKQDYQKAITTYENILANGEKSAFLYYNLGNAYFKNGELPKAILNYEKAALLDPNDSDIQHNLNFAYSNQPDNIEHLAPGFLPRVFQSLYRLFSVDTWAILGIIFLILFCVAISIFLFAQRLSYRRIALSTIICSFILGTTAVSCAQSRHAELTSHEYAIVIEPTTSIKTEPIITATDLATIHGGIKVKIVNEAFGWLKVQLGNGKEGWILAQNIERI